MKCRASIVVGAAERGVGFRVIELRCEPPIYLRQTAADTLHVVGSAAGPLGGDDLDLAVTVLSGSQMCVRSVGATLVLPGVEGLRSRSKLRVEVQNGAALHWALEPTIVCGHSAHLSETQVTLDDGAP